MNKPSYYRDLPYPGQWTGERKFQRSSILCPKVVRQPGCDGDRMDQLDDAIERICNAGLPRYPDIPYGGGE